MMSRISVMSRIRQREIHARRIRHKKLKSLKAHYVAAKSASEKQHVVEKLGRIAPWLSTEKFALMAGKS